MWKGQCGYLLIKLFQSIYPEKQTVRLTRFDMAAHGLSNQQSTLSPVVVSADQTEVFRSKWQIFIKHAIDHALSTQSTQHSEKTRLTKMHTIVLPVMLRAITPLSFKLAVLESVAGNARSRATNVANDILSNIDQCLLFYFHSHLTIMSTRHCRLCSHARLHHLIRFSWLSIRYKPVAAALEKTDLISGLSHKVI